MHRVWWNGICVLGLVPSLGGCALFGAPDLVARNVAGSAANQAAGAPVTQIAESSASVSEALRGEAGAVNRDELELLQGHLEQEMGRNPATRPGRLHRDDFDRRGVPAAYYQTTYVFMDASGNITRVQRVQDGLPVPGYIPTQAENARAGHAALSFAQPLGYLLPRKVEPPLAKDLYGRPLLPSGKARKGNP